MVYHGRLKESLGTPGGSFFYIIQSNPSKPRIFMKRSLQSPSPLLKNQKKNDWESSFLPRQFSPPFLHLWLVALPLLDDYDCTTTLFLFLSIHIQGFRKELNEERKTRRPFSPHLFSFLSNPSPNFFSCSYTNIHLMTSSSWNPRFQFASWIFFSFFLCKIYITYIPPYARTIQWPSISLSHTLSSLNPLYLYYLSLIDFPPFLLICLFYFPVFFLEIYCINNLAVVCFARYNFSFLPFHRSHRNCIRTTCIWITFFFHWVELDEFLKKFLVVFVDGPLCCCCLQILEMISNHSF